MFINSPLDSLYGTTEKNEQLEEFKLQLKDSLKDAIYAYRITKASQLERGSLNYKPHAYEQSDKL